MTLPTLHKQAHFDSSGTIESLTLINAKLPTPDAHQILIKVFAAGVNGPDIAQRQGLYPAPSNASPVLGLEVSR